MDKDQDKKITVNEFKTVFLSADSILREKIEKS